MDAQGHDGDSHDPGAPGAPGAPSKPPDPPHSGLVTVVPLDSTNLHELYLWLRVAQSLVGAHYDETLEIAKSVYPESLHDEIDAEFVGKTVVRLGEFVSALGEVIDEIRLAQAQTELDGTDIDKVH